eukprot:TRINITY_DN18578_c0_g1_i2.p1 TRINITY_DN18578_c0_g1~~TRINITY_DN18578_c0_g1_i2.p1  ORF type:complete len:666 (+),score=117.93 TRINITY_DN18578_c0_g1_i2:9-2006(+)
MPIGGFPWSLTLLFSFMDLQKPTVELGGKPCAAIGQSGLMSLYDTLFGQLDVACSQLLVTDSDFGSSDFRNQLRETVNSLLEHRVVPVFNENDAISTRKAPYKDETGIFWDNDSLAALLSLELGADALVLLSDVDGLYTGPPSDPSSQIIHTYLKDKHSPMVTFGEKSRVGRGGMVAKVDAAWMAAIAGVPVVIASGFVVDGLRKVMRGEHVGTLFHRDAHQWGENREAGAREMAVAARTASRKLQALPSEERGKILLDVASALEANEALILEENGHDIRAAEIAGIAPALLNRLKLKPGKIAQLAEGMRSLARAEEPIGRTLKKMEIADGLILEKQTWSLGVLLIIFEARPDALPQIAALSIRSGNGLLLKGGKEAARSNAILHKVITDALPPAIGRDLIGLVTTREAISDLLQLDDVIDLVIPRGSNALVSHVKANTKIAVLGHADGVCHVYVDKAADLEMAKRVIVDAKLDYPAACNAVETVLVHEHWQATGELDDLCKALEAKGIKIFGGRRASKALSLPPAPALHHEYGDNSCTLEIVVDTGAAIEYIHTNGSAHTDCIVTEDDAAAQLFLRSVDSAAVFHNASTRFADGFRFGLGAEVGISTSRIHARGPVGVEGLLTTRYLLQGKGHVVDKDSVIKYTFKELPLEGNSTANGPTSNGL